MAVNNQGTSLIKLVIVSGLIALAVSSTFATSKSNGVISQIDKKVKEYLMTNQH